MQESDWMDVASEQTRAGGHMAMSAHRPCLTTDRNFLFEQPLLTREIESGRIFNDTTDNGWYFNPWIALECSKLAVFCFITEQRPRRHIRRCFSSGWRQIEYEQVHVPFTNSRVGLNNIPEEHP